MGLQCVPVLFWTLLVCAYGHFDNRMNKPLDFSCPNKQTISSIRSVHDNHYEDRMWEFHCDRRITYKSEEDCIWTGYINAWEKELDFKCPPHMVISGAKSRHKNKKEDRKWRVKCCQTEEALQNCQSSGWLNDWDGAMDFHVPRNYAIRGFYSIHDNWREDRRWKAYICKIVPGGRCPEESLDKGRGDRGRRRGRGRDRWGRGRDEGGRGRGDGGWDRGNGGGGRGRVQDDHGGDGGEEWNTWGQDTWAAGGHQADEPLAAQAVGAAAGEPAV